MKPLLIALGRWTFVFGGSLALVNSVLAASPSGSHTDSQMQHDMPMTTPSEAAGAVPPAPAPKAAPAASMTMGEMQGGAAPPDARDPDAYAEGVHRQPMPGMDMADNESHGMLLIDQLEYGWNDDSESLIFDMQGWYGNDYDKIWLKAEGSNTPDGLGATRTELLWDHAIATFWGAQLGVRHDAGEGPTRNWLAVGVQGLAPYWFDVDAAVYLGESGRSAARLDVEYDLLLTQRLVLQPNLQLNLYGKSDPARAIGAGLSNAEVGVRLRYEFSRQFAPYIGVSWERKFGETADFARSACKDVRERQWLVGVRMWF